MRPDFAKRAQAESLVVLAEEAFLAFVLYNLKGHKHEILDLLVCRHVKMVFNFIGIVEFPSYMFNQFVLHCIVVKINLFHSFSIVSFSGQVPSLKAIEWSDPSGLM